VTSGSRAGASGSPEIDPTRPPEESPGIRCFIGLGSNLGDRASFLRGAVAGLVSTPGIAVLRTSSVYESVPWGYLDQSAYLNAAVEIVTVLEPIQLLITLQTIESRLGRKKRFRWGPREIDLDVLLYGDRLIRRRGFDVPHPSMFERVFVLAPLAELAPELTTPDGEPLLDALQRLDPNGEQTIIQAIPLTFDR
jgi:2-amino-4-hydroxy-6-hydroxymethyldihydropteridine diphosphokinase